MGIIHIERKEEQSFPKIITSNQDPEQVIAITYTDNGKKYSFSNEFGHKVQTSDGTRPMTKTEFKEVRAKMARCILESREPSESLTIELEKLDFAQGHANGTFEVVTSCMSQSNIGALVMHIGPARYIYNLDANSVFHNIHSFPHSLFQL